MIGDPINRRPYFLGLDLQSKQARPCGVCGAHGSMTKAHVPPQSSGNTGLVTRRRIRSTGEGTLSPGPDNIGGIWVRGLCGTCNSLAGGRYDAAYAEFADDVLAWALRSSPTLVPNNVPPVRVYPGPVSRSVLYGMYAISPHLRVLFPALAASLRDGEDSIALPVGMRLRMAIYLASQARVAGPIHAQKVLGGASSFESFAEIFFPPFAWVLESDQGDQSALRAWADLSEWPLYGQDMSLDLRLLVGHVPTVSHPLADSDSWIQMFSDQITPMVEGTVSL